VSEPAGGYDEHDSQSGLGDDERGVQAPPRLADRTGRAREAAAFEPELDRRDPSDHERVGDG